MNIGLIGVCYLSWKGITEINKWEMGVGFLWEKEWGNIITTANFLIDYELGSGVNDEFETAVIIVRLNIAGLVTLNLQ